MIRLLGFVYTWWAYVLVRASQFLLGVAMHPVYNLLSLALVIALIVLMIL